MPFLECNDCTDDSVWVYVHDTIGHDTTRHDKTRYDTTQHKRTLHNATQNNTTRHNTIYTTQHNTTQHNTTQHNKFMTIITNDKFKTFPCMKREQKVRSLFKEEMK